MDSAVELSVSQFVDLFNQTMEVAYPEVVIVGELANLRVSRNRWLYFDLKDEFSVIKFFGTIYQLPGPLEDGLVLKVRGRPRLHNQYGFSINVINIQPSGEGSLKKAADLLKQQLAKEGLFDESRKRALPYPPERIGLITSKQSAAYADFIKVAKARWSGLEVQLIDVQVQGEAAPSQITAALQQFNSSAQPPEAIVVIRGGGSAEDLMAFNTQEVTRAVAASRIPTLVAIGHETDISLAELAADVRASTPSNAAELLVPSRLSYIEQLKQTKIDLNHILAEYLKTARTMLDHEVDLVDTTMTGLVTRTINEVNNMTDLVQAFNPIAILRRGYAIVRDSQSKIINQADQVKPETTIKVQLFQGNLEAKVNRVNN